MEYISETEAEHLFDEYLNDTNEMISICGMQYTPAFVLHEVDKIAYNCLFSDWLDSENLTTDENEGDDENE